MAADVVLQSGFSNPCCAKLNKKYLRVKQDLQTVCSMVTSLTQENSQLKKGKAQEHSQLKKAFAEEHICGKQEKKENIEESSIRKNLEKEIHDLKAEISSYQKKECLINVHDKKNQLLKCQDEIKRLKELLQEEKKKAESEKTKAESEKKKAAEAWKLVKFEKNKAEEDRKLAEIERKKAEEYRFCLEKAKADAKEVREKLNAELSKADDARKRVEAEKQKTNIEKARADTQTLRALEQKRLMEVERKRAIDENIRADCLSQMLEEEKQKREELQKKTEEIVSISKGKCDSCNGEERHNGDVSIISSNMQLLREQLKLEKKQTKYARRMAKLQKAEKNHIMQEINILKHSFMQMLSRLNMLDDHLTRSIEGTEAVAKIRKSSEIDGLKLKNKLLGSKRGNHHSRIDCGLTETCCTGSFNFTEPRRECIDLSLPRGSCMRPSTGTVSELESPIGVSDGNKSQSSVICSNTSYSDKRSMGSQERGSLAVTASAKLKKKHPDKRPTIMKLSSEVTKTRKSEEFGVMANHMDKTCDCREVRNACLTVSVHDKIEVDGEFDPNSKKRKVQDAMEPVARVYPENNQSHIETGKKLSAFKDILNNGAVTAVNCSQGCGSSQNFHNGITYFCEDHNESCRQKCNRDSNTLSSKQQTSVLQALGHNGNQKKRGKFDNQNSRDLSFVAETTPSSQQLRGSIRIEQESISISNEQADLISFESMIRDNCLKLLDLDNEADEERYRMAVEMPLSPTLSGLEFPHQLCVENEAQFVMERDKPVPFHPVDVMVTEIRASNSARNLLSQEDQDFLDPRKDHEKICVELQNSVSQHVKGEVNVPDEKDVSSSKNQVVSDGTIISSSKNQVLSAEITKFTNGDNDIFNAEIAKQDVIHQLSEASKQAALSTGCNIEDSSTGNPCGEVGRTHAYCVMFSNIKDKDSISRILHMRSTFSCQSFMVYQIEHVVVQVHDALAKDTLLLPEEKGGVFFSLLLLNISSRISAKLKCTMDVYRFPCFNHFAAVINKVLSDAEIKSLFKAICPLDIFSGLIEDFLVERKVLMCIDRLYERKESSDVFQMNGAYLFSRAATIDQFVAGCIILASISVAADRIGFLLEASYRILRLSRNDLSWILLALHIFASVCGKEYFNVKEYGFLIIALRSVVLLLERGHQSVSSKSPCLHSIFDTQPTFPPCPPCDECPFAIGAVCTDKLITMLLDVLQCYILTGVGNPDMNDSVCMVPACSERGEENRELDGQTNASHASYCLFKFTNHDADLPDCFPETAFCHFNDIVSLVELVGSYMSWEWTYDKIIPRLLEMLESCKNEDFSAALLVLIGQLGRFGIDVGGHQRKGIAELRCSMSVLVDTNVAMKLSFPTQLAAIGALLNLLPLSFRDIVGEHGVLTLDASQSSHAKLIKKWFSELSKQHQSVALSLFG